MDYLLRFAAIVLSCTVLLGVAQAPPKTPSTFEILGASVHVEVERGTTILPASLVPSLKPGDTVRISFPKGVQFSTSPRWHLVVANMYDDYLQHAPSFPIPDADLSRQKAGYVWSVRVVADATPIFFLIPEDGTRRGLGIPDARAAIETLSNRALLLKTASLSATAEAKKTAMESFMHSLSSVQPQQISDARSRVAVATQSMFGYDLADQACFDSAAAQSTQYACVANAVAQGYDSTPNVNVAGAAVSQLSVNSATYGMLVGTIYQLLMKRRVEANYTFIPGAIKPGQDATDVYVNEQPQYDASGAKPSTIVYFEVGSRSTTPQKPGYTSTPSLPVCVAKDGVDLNMLFNGSPSFFRSHHVIVDAGSTHDELAANYDPLNGYSAPLTSDQYASLANGATAHVESTWGFDTFQSSAIALITPHAASWQLQDPSSSLISGNTSETLAFNDNGAGMARCVQSVTFTDGLGHPIPVTNVDTTKDTVAVTVDASKAQGAAATATFNEMGNVASNTIGLSLLPSLPAVTSAVAYLPKGVLVLRGTGLKYIDSVTLQQAGIVFGNGTPNKDGSWSFRADEHAPFQPAWEHETMTISYSLVPPDKRTAAAEADVQYAP